MAFWIVTDACCDLPAAYLTKRQNLLVVPMSYQIDGDIKQIDPLDPNPEQTAHDFYQKLEGGSNATTFQVNQQDWVDLIDPLCQQGNDVLVLAFSSGLSGTCASAITAVEELQQKYPNQKILAVDSLCASLGEGLFVHLTLAQRDSGKSIEECHRFALDLVPRLIHWFTVDDLHFLRRGGRVSATSAYLGSILKIKPVLNVDPKGKLIPREKVQGRKRSLRSLFEKVQEYAFEPEKQTMFISHGDCKEDALWLADKLKAELSVPEVMISTIGPIIGSHSGPGTVAMFFVGKDAAGRMTSPTE
ncbi:MAG: DegV family protein [Candidatus Limiplasma sp.]|nr:DegV family protein [Candidatus Limiplasma sp.]